MVIFVEIGGVVEEGFGTYLVVHLFKLVRWVPAVGGCAVVE